MRRRGAGPHVTNLSLRRPSLLTSLKCTLASTATNKLKSVAWAGCRRYSKSTQEPRAYSGLPPHRLELEITESVLLGETEANLTILHQLRDLAERPDCMAIIRAVTGLGASLGISTTAEGVETRAQLDGLRAEGCTKAQGFLFSRPRPSADIMSLLAIEKDRTKVA